MKVIITGAGKGSRFRNIGIYKPKYQLTANKKPLFYWSMRSLEVLKDQPHIFIFNKENFDEKFIKKWLSVLGIKKFKIIIIDEFTNGQATTASLAGKYIKDKDDVLIFNVDTFIKPKSIKKSFFRDDGSVVCTNALGDHWSFIRKDKNNYAIQASEKIRISNEACVGIYYFKKWKDFKALIKNHGDDVIKKYKELYIAPLYQYMINDGKKIYVPHIDVTNLICLGTPKEIESFDKNWLKANIEKAKI